MRHAARLLAHLGADPAEDPELDGLAWDRGPGTAAGPSAPDVAGDWASSGVVELTGEPGAAPQAMPGEAASAARGAGLALTAVASLLPWAGAPEVDGARLLSERAELLVLRGRGRISPNGSCRMVRAADGWLAVNLARPDDLRMLEAWLETPAAGIAEAAEAADLAETARAADTAGATGAVPAGGPWTPVLAGAVDAACAGRGASELAGRAGLMGLPVAVVPPDPARASDEQSRGRWAAFPPAPWHIAQSPDRASGRDPGVPLVVDLSALWAGPLCAHLLHRVGCEVVTVESEARPDPSRTAAPEFHRRLHDGHRSEAFDLTSAGDRERLGVLLASADVVVEGSRPRALDQLGLGPAVVLGRSPSTVWVSITGYGRTGPWADRVAFGDDAAAAAGLVARNPTGAPLFCGDAIADPLTGLHAAVAALAMLAAGRGGLVDAALRDVAASTLSAATGGAL